MKVFLVKQIIIELTSLNVIRIFYHHYTPDAQAEQAIGNYINSLFLTRTRVVLINNYL